MTSDREIELLQLMGVDDTAVRAYYTFNLLERFINARRRSRLDALFVFVSGLIGLIDYLVLLQIPETLPVVVSVSVGAIIVAAYLWWRQRNKSHGEALSAYRSFGVALDRMRRWFRQLKLAESLVEGTTDLEAIKNQIRRDLKMATDVLGGLKRRMDDEDYEALNEDQDRLWNEINGIRREYGFDADLTGS